MGGKQITESIRSVSLWIGMQIQVWLVQEPDGITLIDTGIGPMGRSIVKEIERMNAGPLKRILLTHGHADHVGGLKTILDKYPVPVYMHAAEIPYAEGDLAYPGKDKAMSYVAKGILQPLPTLPGRKGELAVLDSLAPYFTPGHSPGHVVYFHAADRVLLAGDLFNAKRGRLIPPRFTPDPDRALRSADILHKLNPEQLQVCHGGAVFSAAAKLDDLLEQDRQAKKMAEQMKARRGKKAKAGR
ncbi:MBL fold metallo-hydrolase [Saccharibacillus sp. O16]|nr:MBL fold metallo-hydrolase [Saccharibacillus sp. O16]